MPFVPLYGLAAALTLGVVILGSAPMGWADPVASMQTTPQPVLGSLSTKNEFEKMCRDLRESENLYWGVQQVERLEQELQAESDPRKIIDLKKTLATERLRFGKNVDAARLLSEALQMAAAEGFEAQLQIQLLLELGVALLRIGEVTNCVNQHTPEMCILPIREGGRHGDPRAAGDAMEAFQDVLEGVPGYTPAEWLVNIAAMTVGRYPDGVKPEYRLPPENLQSEYDIGRFRDISGEVGLHIFGNAGGALVDDFDGDGWLDIVTSSVNPCSPLHFFVNDGKGGFEDRTHASGLAEQLGGLNLVHADYNNDGHLDILVLRGGWFANQGRMRNSLLRNNGDGTFTDVTFAVGLAEPAYPTQTAAWADFDNDGDIDLYVGNEGGFDTPSSKLRAGVGDSLYTHASQLFRNDLDRGTEKFTDIAESAGVTNLRWAKGVTWGDFDGDGDEDLYVSNIGPNRLYRNDGGKFLDVAATMGVLEPAARSFATWFFDYDNDGDLDLFVADYVASMVEIARYYLNSRREGAHVRLYRNDGGEKKFTDVSKQMGLDVPSLPMGANYGDLDNDGFLDIYLGTGTPAYYDLMPNLMYRNDGGRRFVDVTFSGGFGHLQKGHGVAFADVDNDGDQDIFEEMGGAYPGDTYRSVLYENPGHGNRWINIKLKGRQSNRGAIGTRLRLDLESPTGARSVYRRIGTGGSFGGSPLRAEIGLGDATAIRKLEVFWPASELLQAFDDVQVDGFYSLEEGGALQSLSALLPPENANPKPGTSSASTTSAGGGL